MRWLHVCELLQQVAVRPATRVGDWVIVPGGKSRRLTPDELAAHERGEDVRVSVASCHPTTLIGQRPPYGDCPHCGTALRLNYPSLSCPMHGPIEIANTEGR